MRKRMLALVVVLLSVTVMLTPSAECSGCNASAREFCNARSTEAFMDCILLTPYDTVHCLVVQEDAYDACMLVMGCPQPPRIP